MAKSWTNPCTIGYEIKIARNDFLKDEKWRNYLNFCNQLYFVAPPKIINPEEVPEEVGLFISTVNGTRLYMKKKALFRNIEMPETVFRYILMNRVKLDLEYQRDRKLYWQNWLKEKDEKKELGWNVSYKIRQEMERRCHKVETENHKLKRENDQIAEAKAIFDKLGLNLFSWHLEQDIKDKIREVNSGLPGGLKSNLEIAAEHLMKAINICTARSDT